MANWSPDRQQAVQARCDKATKGPWESNRVVPGVVFNVSPVDDLAESVLARFASRDLEPNAEFTAHARQDLPDALAEIARQQADLTRLAEVLAEADELANCAEALYRVSTNTNTGMGVNIVQEKAGKTLNQIRRVRRLIAALDAKEAARE